MSDTRLIKKISRILTPEGLEDAWDIDAAEGNHEQVEAWAHYILKIVRRSDRRKQKRSDVGKKKGHK